MTAPTRDRLVGVRAIAKALDRSADSGDDAVRCLVVPDAARDPRIRELQERAAARGIPVHAVAPRRFERLRGADEDAEILALLGPEPGADLTSVMARGGAVWLLTGTAYPGNAGFAIRTAEVSGADGIYIDNDFDHAGRREATRAGMRADRFLPVGWEPAEAVIEAAQRAGKRIVGVEDVGNEPPWRVDLTGSVLLLVGAEADGIPETLLESCDVVTRLPMAGFIASYNLQTAVAAIAIERFRQLEEIP